MRKLSWRRQANSLLYSNNRLTRQHKSRKSVQVFRNEMPSTWQRTSPGGGPGLPRSGHASVCLPSTVDGDLIVFGGYTEDAEMSRAATNETWIFRKGRWDQLIHSSKSSPQARLVTQAAIVGDNIYIVGGWDPGQRRDGGQILNDLWKLSLTDHSWTLLSIQGLDLQPTSRHQALAVGQSIYIHNHRTTDHILKLDTGQNPPALSSIPINCSKHGHPSSRGLHSLTAVANMLYLFGGAPKQGDMLDDLWRLDLRTMAWEQLHPTGKTPRARCSHTATAIGSKIFFFGGSYHKAGGLQPLNDLFVLDTELLMWQWPDIDVPSAPAPRNAHVAAALPDEGLLISGGWDPFKNTYNDTFILNAGDLSYI